MKKLIILTSLILCSNLVLAQSKQKTDTLKMVSWLKAGNDSVKVFYGLPAHKIVKLPVEEAKKFIKEKRITVDQYFTAKLKAGNYLKEMKIKRDSIETMRIYKRIERKLGIQKGNGNNRQSPKPKGL